MNTDKTVPAERGAQPKQGKRRIRYFRVAVTLFILILLLTLGTWWLLSATYTDDEGIEQSLLFGIETIEIEGNTRYNADDLIRESGILKGQSLLMINKRAAADRIMKKYPYIETVNVYNKSFSSVGIEVTEVKVLGITPAVGKWYVLGANGKILEEVPVTGERPADKLFIQLNLDKVKLNEKAADDWSMETLTNILAYSEHYKLSGLNVIDLTVRTDVQLLVREVLTVRLGNTLKLETAMETAVQAIANLAGNNKDLNGELDLRGLNYDEQNRYAPRFIPRDVLGSYTTHAAGITGTTIPAEGGGTTSP